MGISSFKNNNQEFMGLQIIVKLQDPGNGNQGPSFSMNKVTDNNTNSFPPFKTQDERYCWVLSPES